MESTTIAAELVTFLFLIWEVRFSKTAPETGYPDRDFRDSPQSVKENFGSLSQIRI
jgi:hypothetical protein